MEMGLVEGARGHRTIALEYWENGIAAQPNLPSNYFFAAQTLYEIGDFGWASIDAEIFISLERTGERVRDMSRLLMHCFEKARRYDYQKAFIWQFYQAKSSEGNPIQPVGKLDSLLDQAFSTEFSDTAATISIPKLMGIRRFVCHLLPQVAPTDPSVGLWEWLQLIGKSGHLEAYHYFLLYDARSAEFMLWFESHQPQYEEFEDWFSRNAFYRHIKHPVLRVAVASSSKL